MKTSHLLRLPTELHFEIIKYLHYASDVNALSQTCWRLWRVTDPWFYHRYALDCPPSGLERISASGNVDALRRLFSAGAGFPQEQDPTGTPKPRKQFVPYVNAMANGHLDIARLIVEVYGPDIIDDRSTLSFQVDNGETLLQAGLLSGHCDIIQYLLDILTPPGQPGRFWPCISRILSFAQPKCPLLFLRSIIEDQRCDVNVLSNSGERLIGRIIGLEWPTDAIEALLDAGADSQVKLASRDGSSGETVFFSTLYYAIYYNREDLVQCLLAREGHRDFQKDLKPRFLKFLTKMVDGWGPSVPGLVLRHFKELLISNYNTAEDRKHILAVAAATRDVHLVHQILNMVPVSSDALELDLKLALKFAARFGHIDIVKILLPSEHPTDGPVSLSYIATMTGACEGKQTHIIDLLLELIGPQIWLLSGNSIWKTIEDAVIDAEFTRYLVEHNVFDLMLKPFLRRYSMGERAIQCWNYPFLQYTLNEIGVKAETLCSRDQKRGLCGSWRYRGIMEYAARRGDVDVFRFLLGCCGAVLDPNQPAWGSILVKAAGTAQVDIVKLFLDSGFDVNARYDMSSGPSRHYYDWDSDSGSDDDSGAEIDADRPIGATILEIAMHDGLFSKSRRLTEMVRLILDRGADIYTVNSRNEYLFDEYISRGSYFLEGFFAHGLDPLTLIKDGEDKPWIHNVLHSLYDKNLSWMDLRTGALLARYLIDQDLPCEVFKSFIPGNNEAIADNRRLSGTPSGDWGWFEVVKMMWRHYWRTKYPVPEQPTAS